MSSDPTGSSSGLPIAIVESLKHCDCEAGYQRRSKNKNMNTELSLASLMAMAMTMMALIS
jgi:hypothetical protein